MQLAKAEFLKRLSEARQMGALHAQLALNFALPIDLTDIIRFQIVYAVSAFDKLIHDLIRIGMVQSFAGTRSPTPRYLAEPISLSKHTEIASATTPTPASVFEAEVFRKLSVMPFQDPSKVADGLSLIWNESHKWQAVALRAGSSEEETRKRLKLIVGRRNSIVHEADIDPVSGLKQSIDEIWVKDATDFVQSCGEAIVECVL